MNPLDTALRPVNPRMLGPHMFAAMRKMALSQAYPILDAPTLEAAFGLLVRHVYGTSPRTAVTTEDGTERTVIAWLLDDTGDEVAPDDSAVAVLHLSPRDPAEWAKQVTTRPVRRSGWRLWNWWPRWWARFNVRMARQTLLDIAMHGAAVADFTMQEYLATPEDGNPGAKWMRTHLVVALWHDRQIAAGADPQAVQTMIALRGWPVPSVTTPSVAASSGVVGSNRLPT